MWLLYNFRLLHLFLLILIVRVFDVLHNWGDSHDSCHDCAGGVACCFDHVGNICFDEREHIVEAFNEAIFDFFDDQTDKFLCFSFNKSNKISIASTEIQELVEHLFKILLEKFVDDKNRIELFFKAVTARSWQVQDLFKFLNLDFFELLPV